jgi:hypothetical protein
MTIKNIHWLWICVLLGGCEIIPKFNQCESPKFIASDINKIDKYFLTEDVFAKFCPAETPKVFTYQVTPTIVVSIYLKDKWVYLRANSILEQLDIYAEGARVSSFKGYTHVVPINALKDNMLKITVDKTLYYEMKFTVVDCTCVYY